MIIDIHGHYTTAPKALEDYRKRQIAALADPAQPPLEVDYTISDDEIRESIQRNQLPIQKKRGVDLTIFSPRAGGMAHHYGNATTSKHWTQACNDLIHRVCTMFPDNYVGVCQLPQSPGVSPKNCIPEDNVLFASEIVGAVRGIDPDTGHHFDDTKRYIDGIDWLTPAQREKVYNANAFKVYPRLEAHLKRRTK